MTLLANAAPKAGLGDEAAGAQTARSVAHSALAPFALPPQGG